MLFAFCLAVNCRWATLTEGGVGTLGALPLDCQRHTLKATNRTQTETESEQELVPVRAYYQTNRVRWSHTRHWMGSWQPLFFIYILSFCSALVLCGCGCGCFDEMMHVACCFLVWCGVVINVVVCTKLQSPNTNTQSQGRDSENERPIRLKLIRCTQQEVYIGERPRSLICKRMPPRRGAYLKNTCREITKYR